MSGGSQDYLCFKVRDLVEDLFKNHSDPDLSSLRVEQIKSVYKMMSNFMHSVEWVESGDSGCEKLDEALILLKKEINTVLKNVN